MNDSITSRVGSVIRLTAACAAALLLWVPAATAQQNDMAFTATIRPWGTNSFDITIQNDTLESITGLSILMDGTDHKFAYIYSDSLTRSARVLEPLYIPGGIGGVREVFKPIPGNEIAFLTSWPLYPNFPASRNIVGGNFEAPINIGDGYGQRIHGYLVAPQTGFYTFWIASDDNGQLWLSSNTNPANATLIASVPGWTSPNQWNKYSSQQSAPIFLQAGNYYYISALGKEGAGLDNLSVGWQRPSGAGTLLQRPMPMSNIRLAGPGGGGQLNIDDPSSSSASSDSIRMVDIAGLNRGSTLKFQAAFTAPPANAASVLWNNGFTRQNAIIRVYGAEGGIGELTLYDTASNELNRDYVFQTDKRPRTLTVSSEVLGGDRFISNFVVSIFNKQGGLLTNVVNPSTTVTIPYLSDGMRVSIAAANEVYLGAATNYLFDSSNVPADGFLNSTNPPRQRFVTTGLSVNNTPQTGDPSQYSFDLNGDTTVTLRWRHDFALVINHDFTATESIERDPQNNPWAGPLVSSAAGNPSPDSTKIHWIAKGDSVIAQIDGQVLDFSRPGLDIRYVPKAYRARGSARGVFVGTPVYTNEFTVGQTPPQRQQVDSFAMNDWASIEYIWQIQFGVKVNVDDASRSALPRVFRVGTGTNSAEEVIGSLEGTFWFNPGEQVKVASAARVGTNATSSALSGWVNGDGFYFVSSGEINSQNGSLLTGQPLSDGNGPVAEWQNSFFANDGKEYRGLAIPNLRRPARVLWLYGSQIYQDTVRIGAYMFQTNEMMFTANASLASLLLRPPDAIEKLSVAGSNQNVPDPDMAVWDPNAQRLYPVVPGLFRATWNSADGGSVRVLVDVLPPEQPHYPHIAGTPPVQLTPDPTGTFFFKELKYTENDAAISGGSLFTAQRAGRTVLLFGEIKRIGRGDPKEYLRVRMVDTRTWNNDAPSPANAIIGQAIRDTTLDEANLGTGYVFFNGARYNPSIYDATKLDGIRARDVYDVQRLRSTAGEKIVVNRTALPGPVIPVNLHPGASAEQRIVVVWYKDPRQTDEILWPYTARTYLPVWPTNEAQGLGRIVIASQFGSDGVNGQNQDQLVAPGFTNITSDGQGGLLTNIIVRSTSYNPTRIQQPAVYVQNNPAVPGYNPNEEHALMAPSLRYAQVSPRPPAAYALRFRDLNRYNRNTAGENGQPSDYTSHPFVLVQYFDTAISEFAMRVYEIEKEITTIPNYRFANQAKVTPVGISDAVTASPQSLAQEPYVRMEAGEPVIPFYPLGVVIGASPAPETFGRNIKSQSTYWEDHKGTAWAVSGGENAWFTYSIYYPLAPGFWWPAGQPGRIVYNEVTEQKRAAIPNTGDSISFMPNDISTIRGLAVNSIITEAAESNARPNRILYKSDWPTVAPVLKAGETLTYSGGEYRQDNPTTQFLDGDGALQSVPTPGLPGVLGFAVGEVVFDALNPRGETGLLTNSWTVRMGQVLDIRTQPLSIGNFPTTLLPASGRTRVSGGKYVFNDLPASLQKRFRFDPIAQSVDPATGITISGRLEMSGFVNDKGIGESTLTAPPPAVYILEPNIMTEKDRDALLALAEDSDTGWRTAVNALYEKSRNPAELQDANGQFLAGKYLIGLQQKVLLNPVTQQPILVPIEPGSDVLVPFTDPKTPEPARQFGPGLALIPNAGFMDPFGIIPGNPAVPYPDVSWVTVAENNDPSMGGSPVTLHVIKVDRRERYRGAIKNVLSDNVFDENVVMRHTGDFGANADELVFEWWYRPDDGSLNVPPPFIVNRGTAAPWLLFPDTSGKQGLGRAEILLKGNPNTPETLIADSWWFARYRHKNDTVQDTDWYRPQQNGDSQVNFEWAGAGNNDPFNDFNLDGYPDYRAQLSSGWIKRVLDAVNPYEARIRDFEGDNPSTVSSMLQQLGPRYEGPVALNPDKNVIENVGLIELYETILNRAANLSINLSTPVSTPAIANALQLASTRLSDFYALLANEAYTDAKDPTIGIGSGSVDFGAMAPAVFSFQNQLATLIEEELSLLRGVDDFFARPVYNRLFWNFTKGEGEAAYALNYNVSDINQDGFIDEDDAMILYPQGHGDAWGHYLTALRKQYDLLRHPFFNWVARSEFYNLMDIVLKVDFLDERKFAQIAASKARAGAEIVASTYRDHYVEDVAAQWQGYADVNPDRAWGVQDWARRGAQGAYFDWLTANALLPSEHPNTTLEGIQKVDRKANTDIKVISANLNQIQQTFDDANLGLNPLRLSSKAVPFDINPMMVDDLVFGRSYFEQIYDRAVTALENARMVWDNANQSQNRLRQISTSEAEFRNDVFQEDLSFRNQLIEIFGRPYDGTVGPGKLYPAGYDGPDVALYMYVNVREINNSTVPGPSLGFATFADNGTLTKGDLLDAYNGLGGNSITTLGSDLRGLFAATFAPDSSGTVPALARNGWYSVNYTDIDNPKVALDNFAQLMPVKASGYTFQAPTVWGSRPAVGELQTIISEMIQQEAEIAAAIAAWDALTGEIIRTIRLVNAQLATTEEIRIRNLGLQISRTIALNIVKTVNGIIEIAEDSKETVTTFLNATVDSLPKIAPTVGLAVSPGDVLAPARGGLTFAGWGAVAGISLGQSISRGILLGTEVAFDIAENAVNLANADTEMIQAQRELLKSIEDLVGDEPALRVAIFKEIEALRALSDRYRSVLAQGARLIDERAAFNKRVAAMTQMNRYQDMAFRVHRNHALQVYNSMFDVAARYAYLAAKAYDYETNFDPNDPGSPSALYSDIIKARTLGLISDGVPQPGEGGLAAALAWLRINHDAMKGTLGFNNPQYETGKMSLRTELFRILPSGYGEQPDEEGFPEPGADADELWRQTLENARVANLWDVPEYRNLARPFASDIDASGNAAVEPGIVLRFSTTITAGQNAFGRPLSGGDHAFDPSVFATKIRSVGVWFSDYLSDDVLSDLPQAPRVYLFPVGADIMAIPNQPTPEKIRVWNIVDQAVPVPIPAVSSQLDRSRFTPLLDSLNGRIGTPRRYSSFRAYHNAEAEVDYDELVFDSRLVGRSVWNTEWIMIIPGLTLNSDPDEGLDRFIDQVTDINIIFQTYGFTGY
ncbi:MAG TPA: PA14 domain-containing protein [Kiritimatiellia bacterium]|nr:PA14 domain-containing protein [Kiritimatiellia bacterium]HMP34717.1 PA14 domain-containing protein [Kiritimatiellia bacterium]